MSPVKRVYILLLVVSTRISLLWRPVFHHVRGIIWTLISRGSGALVNIKDYLSSKNKNPKRNI